MNDDRTARSSGSGATPRGDDEIAVLLGRLVDGEASDDDRARFEGLAAERPALRRRLDEQRRAMEHLTDEFDRTVGRAAEVELPPASGPVGRITGVGARRSVGRAALPWALALTGWAALIALGIAWMAGVFASNVLPAPVGAEPRPAANNIPPIEDVETPDEHLARYLETGNVLGELEPVLLEAEELPDGRLVVRYLRRIEEFVVLRAEDDLPVDENGYLTLDPSELRPVVTLPKPKSD